MNDDNKKYSNKLSASFPTFRKLGSPRFLKFAGILMLAIVTLIALFYAIENWRGAREWNQVRADLTARGEPLSFSDLISPMPPEDENFAMISHFDGAFDRSIDLETGAEKWGTWLANNSERDQPVASGQIELVGDWRLGERSSIRWSESEIELLGEELGVQLSTNQPVDAMRHFLTLHETEMAEIEIALQRPHSQFPIRYEDNHGAMLPHLSEIKRFARLFAFRAHVHLDEGDSDAALSDVVSILRLANTIENEPVLISQLVRGSVIQFSLQAIWDGLADDDWSAEQLQMAQNTLSEIDLLSSYQLAMRGEMMFGLDLCDIAERERNWVGIGASDNYDPTEQFDDMVINNAPKGWYLHNKAFMARFHTELSIPAVDPDLHRVYLDRVLEYDERLSEEVVAEFKLFIARLVMPAVGQAALRFAEVQSSVDQAMIACALERHRIVHGEFPAELEMLVPEFIQKLQHDLIDGEPLRYSKKGDSFVLYSIGANETDDGGVPGFDEDRKGKHWRRDEGDWVWKYPDAAGR